MEENLKNINIDVLKNTISLTQINQDSNTIKISDLNSYELNTINECLEIFKQLNEKFI